MKISKAILALLICIPFLASCEKEENKNSNFYNTEYRKGLWVSPNKKDTLEFISSSRMIRKGFYYNYEEYAYKIENNTLIIETEPRTKHSILEVEKEKVVLDNMYITTQFLDNSGIFIKQ